jgi:hypothetical protein
MGQLAKRCHDVCFLDMAERVPGTLGVTACFEDRRSALLNLTEQSLANNTLRAICCSLDALLMLPLLPLDCHGRTLICSLWATCINIVHAVAGHRSML